MKKTVVIFILSMLAWSVVAQERDLAADARRAFEEGRYADAVELYGAVYIQDGKDYSSEKETASQCSDKIKEAAIAASANLVDEAVADYKFVLSKNPKDPVASEYVKKHDKSSVVNIGKSGNDKASYINGHEYVDLGLPSGLKWATCNVGASTPEEYGDYYAWGEIGTKTSYSESNSSTYGKSLTELRNAGIIDGSNRLTLSHDAARANWGGTWRMPTYPECKELMNKCTWTWTTQNSVTGYKVTGPNGRSIFLPAAGWHVGSLFFGLGNGGDYWSSTVINDSHCANGINSGIGGLYRGSFYRESGRSVRPVSE